MNTKNKGTNQIGPSEKKRAKMTANKIVSRKGPYIENNDLNNLLKKTPNKIHHKLSNHFSNNIGNTTIRYPL